MNHTDIILPHNARPSRGTGRPFSLADAHPGPGTPLFDKILGMLSEISSAVTLCRDIHSLAQLVLDIALHYIGAHRGSVMRADEGGNLRIIASRGTDPALLTEFQARRGEGVSGKLMANCLPVIVRDIETDERFRKQKGASYRTKSFISHPIMCNHTLRGIINIGDKKDAPCFDESDLTLLEIVAKQSSVALENALLMHDLKTKAIECEEMNEMMLQSDLAKMEFLMRASHDLRTPLNSVKGATYYLKTSSRLSRADQEEFINIIANEADKLAAIVEELLVSFGSERLTNSADKAPVNIASQLADLVSMPRLRKRLAHRDVSVSLQSEGSLSHVVGDRMSLLNLLYRLVDGLSAHAARGSTIAVSLHENDYVQVDFTISAGLPRAAADCLVNHAPVLDAARPPEQLGLSLARQMADTHQWTITVNDAGQGTCVTLLIPKHSKTKRDAFMSIAMGLFLDLVAEMLCANRCSLMVIERPTKELRIVSSRGIHGDVARSVTVKLGEGISGSVALHAAPLFAQDIESEASLRRPNLPQYLTKSFISLPLVVGGLPVAVVNLANKQDGSVFSTTDLSIASALCERFSRCLEVMYSADHEDRHCKEFISCVERLVSAATRYHKKGSLIPDLMARLFDALARDEKERDQAVYASAVYDLGLVLLGDTVLEEEHLSPAARRAITSHPLSTVCVLKRFEFSDDILKGVIHHHERYDGAGYPDGLKGEAIPLLSRALAVVDSYTAMLCDRPHRKALSRAEALARMREGAETLYDPLLVEALERAVAFTV